MIIVLVIAGVAAIGVLILICVFWKKDPDILISTPLIGT
jgi:hypothetical protein